MSWWMLLDAVVAVESRSSVAPLASICGGVPGLTRRWKGSTGDTRCSLGLATFLWFWVIVKVL